MGFFIKKLLGSLLMPLPMLLAVGIAGGILWARGRRPRLGRALVGGALAALVALSLGPVSFALGRAVESGFPPFPGDSVAYVVVLGGGGASDPFLPTSARLPSQSLYRLVEGLRIAAAQPWATLVLSGYGGTDPTPAAEVYRDVAASLGFPQERMHVDPRGRDTAEEARYLEPLLRGRPFALVTSATHMRRAVTLFGARGLTPVPAPTGHLARTRNMPWMWALIPSEDDLRVSRQAWYELLGRMWVGLRGAGAD